MITLDTFVDITDSNHVNKNKIFELMWKLTSYIVE